MTPIPKATVIIPSYNRSRVLRRSVGSVLAQTFDDFELIVVDDASTDDTQEVVASYRDPRIRYIRQESNRGGAAARDRGIREARGEYVAFLDDDDEWRPEFLERVDAAFTSQPDAGVVEAWATDDADELYSYDSDDVYEQLLTRKRSICFSAIAVRRNAIPTGLTFDNPTRLAQDRHFFMEIAKSHPFVTIAEPLARLHRESGAYLNTARNQWKAMNHFFELHAEELRDRPAALALHHGEMGKVLLQLGETTMARRQFQLAIVARPFPGKWWGWWLLTAFGSRAFGMARRIQRLRKRGRRYHS